jgi:ligand-binding sensor protein
VGEAPGRTLPCEIGTIKVPLSENKEEEKMKLVDMMPIEKWVEIEKEINRQSGLNAAVYDVEGVRITDFKKWANRLCPALRETEKGQEFICAVAHQNIAAQTVKTGTSVVDECDAGLMKFATPIFVENEFLGVAGGCGLLRNQEQVDTYLVHRTTGLDEEVIEALSEDIERIPNDRLESVISYLEKKVAEVIREFRTDPQGSI